MDRNWINFFCISDEYGRGVQEFIQFAQRNANNSGHDGAKIRCLCVNCLNGRIRKSGSTFYVMGFFRSYTTWTWHVFTTCFRN